MEGQVREKRLGARGDDQVGSPVAVRQAEGPEQSQVARARGEGLAEVLRWVGVGRPSGLGRRLMILVP